MPRSYRKSSGYSRKRKYQSKGARKSSRRAGTSRSKRVSTGFGAAIDEGIKHLSRTALLALKSKLGMNAETKYVDAATTGFTVGALDDLQQSQFNNCQTAIAQGLTAQQRSGDSCRMTRFLLHGQLVASSAASRQVQVRVMIVNCGKVPASLVTAADLLQDPTDVNSPLTDDPVNTVKVLLDRTVQVGTNAPSTSLGNSAAPIQPFEFNYTPLDHHIRWTAADTAGTQANCIEGNIQVWMMSSSIGGIPLPSSTPTLSLWNRVEFVDN